MIVKCLRSYKKANSQNFRINRTIKKMYNQNGYGLFFLFQIYFFLILHSKVILHQFWMKKIFPSKFNLEYGLSIHDFFFSSRGHDRQSSDQNFSSRGCARQTSEQNNRKLISLHNNGKNDKQCTIKTDMDYFFYFRYIFFWYCTLT
jgi:hypothetical protein